MSGIINVLQIKILGEIEGSSLVVGQQKSYLVMQQQNCEAETLKVFRRLTSQVCLFNFKYISVAEIFSMIIEICSHLIDIKLTTQCISLVSRKTVEKIVG